MGSFIGVLLIVFGRESTEMKTDAGESEQMLYWVLLVCTPVVIAMGDFKTSKISRSSKVDNFFIPWWSSFLCLVIFGVAFMLSTAGYPTSAAFWLIATLMSGVTSTLGWVLKIIAFKYDRVSRVAPIFYVESVFSLMFDYFVFHVSFGWM